MSILYKETCNITIQSVVPGLNMLAILKKQHHIKSGGWMLTQIFLMKHPYVCWLERETHVYPKLTNTDVEHQWFP